MLIIQYNLRYMAIYERVGACYHMKKIIIVASVVIVLILIGYISLSSISKASGKYNYEHESIITSTLPFIPIKDNTYNNPTSEYDSNNIENGENEDMLYEEVIQSWDLNNGPDLEPTSIRVLVNKEHALPKNYVPENMVVPNILFDIIKYDDKKLLRKEAATAIELLFEAATDEGYILYGVSGYRSYERQFKIFTTNLVRKGKTHTLRYSAVPGTSEHQTGLAMDVSIKSLGYKLIPSFASTPEAIWLADNAHYYGYIIRYPKDKTDITGYAYEPWHIRYVGIGLATYLYDNNLTLEEYYHYKPSDNFNFELAYANILNYRPRAEELLEENEEEVNDEDFDELDEELLNNTTDSEDLVEEIPEITPPIEKPKKKPKKPDTETTDKSENPTSDEEPPIEEQPTDEIIAPPQNPSNDDPSDDTDDDNDINENSDTDI